MLLTVVRVYQRGRKLTEAELRSAVGVVGDVRIHVVQTLDGRSVLQAVCMGGSKDALPALIEPQLTGMSVQSLGLEGFEEARTTEGIVFYRQGWWCRMR